LEEERKRRRLSPHGSRGDGDVMLLCRPTLQANFSARRAPEGGASRASTKATPHHRYSTRRRRGGRHDAVRKWNAHRRHFCGPPPVRRARKKCWLFFLGTSEGTKKLVFFSRLGCRVETDGRVSVTWSAVDCWSAYSFLANESRWLGRSTPLYTARGRLQKRKEQGHHTDTSALTHDTGIGVWVQQLCFVEEVHQRE
jgi:hypothetical protein